MKKTSRLRQPDRVRCDRPPTERFSFDEVRLGAIGDAVPPDESHGVWIGLLHLGEDGSLRTARLSDLLSRVLGGGGVVRVVYGRGGWINVNDLRDLLDASGL